MTEAKLLPCPFCDAKMEAHHEYSNEYHHAYKRGERCPAGSVNIYIDDVAAVAAWNRRPSAGAEPEVVEAARRVEIALRDGCDDGLEADSLRISRALLSVPQSVKDEDGHAATDPTGER